jgi:hypothetical protein
VQELPCRGYQLSYAMQPTEREHCRQLRQASITNVYAAVNIKLMGVITDGIQA